MLFKSAATHVTDLKLEQKFALPHPYPLAVGNATCVLIKEKLSKRSVGQSNVLVRILFLQFIIRFPLRKALIYTRMFLLCRTFLPDHLYYSQYRIKLES